VERPSDNWTTDWTVGETTSNLLNAAWWLRGSFQTTALCQADSALSGSVY
jgi:hypothetical protein